VNLAAINRICTEDRAHGLGTAGTNQARKAQNLSAVCLKVNTKEYAALLQVLNLQNRLGTLLTELLGELIVQAAAYHCGNERVIVPILGVSGLDELTVTDNGNTVTQLEQLFQLMRNEHDADAACLQVTAGLHQLFNFL